MEFNPLPRGLRRAVLERREIVLAVIAVNLAGTVFGFYYYLDQLSAARPWFWIFVADSPVATLLMASSLITRLKDYSSAVLDGLAFLGNFKYGLWTSFILVFYFETFYTTNSTAMYAFLLSSHLLMAAQAFLVVDYAEIPVAGLAAAGSWFLLNDFLDYFLDMHTWIYVDHGHPFSPAMAAAFLLTASGIAVYSYHLVESQHL